MDEAAQLRECGLQVTAQRARGAAGGARPRRTAPPTRSSRSCGPSSAPSRARRCTTCSGRSPRRACSGASSPPARRPATRTASATTTTTSSAATCGQIVDVDCAVGDTPCLTAADDCGLRDRRGRGHLLGPMPRLRRGRIRGVRALTTTYSTIRKTRATEDPMSEPRSESENPVIAAPTAEAELGRTRTRTGGRTSSTCRSSHQHAPRPTRWAPTSTTRRSSRPSTSTR